MSEMSDFAKNAVIVTPDLTALDDGDYTGSYASGIVSATVRLRMTDHRIADFTILKHVTGKGKPAEALAAVVVEEQSLSVDSVSGATVSSKVILKAAEIALGQEGSGP
jgi:uncharacterized protein with FMN-binding domain